jgi:hypothetical protein
MAIPQTVWGNDSLARAIAETGRNPAGNAGEGHAGDALGARRSRTGVEQNLMNMINRVARGFL